MEFLNDYYIPTVLVLCLCLGYIMKQWLPTDNRIIPTVLFIIGAVCGCIALGMSFESVVKGGLTGLAATGLHQAFAQFIHAGAQYDDVAVDAMDVDEITEEEVEVDAEDEVVEE